MRVATVLAIALLTIGTFLFAWAFVVVAFKTGTSADWVIPLGGLLIGLGALLSRAA